MAHKMNKKQKETLEKLFNEQQKLNLELFKEELRTISEHMDYNGEKMSLTLSIYNSKKSLIELEKL